MPEGKPAVPDLKGAPGLHAGAVQSVGADTFTVENAAGQRYTYRVTSQTIFYAGKQKKESQASFQDLKPGALVRVRAKEDGGALIALRVETLPARKKVG
jgi:hypothetical protein